MNVLDEYWETASKLALQVMKLMGLGLHLDNPNIIADSHNFGSKENETAIRVNFYPATADKGKYERILYYYLSFVLLLYQKGIKGFSIIFLNAAPLLF